MSENSAEARTRFETNIPRKPVILISRHDNSVKKFKSSREAGLLGVTHHTISRHCNGFVKRNCLTE